MMVVPPDSPRTTNPHTFSSSPPDLDRLRESRQRPFPIVAMFGLSNPMYRVDSPDEAEGWAMDEADYRAWADAIDFLLSLADEGGRLERVVLCEHGFDESHRVFTDARGMERCAKGSRTVVWPTDKEESA